MYGYELVCSKCLIHNRFFKTDKKSLIDSCPQCGGTTCILYADLGIWSKKDLACDLKGKWERKEVRKHVLKMTAFGYGVMIIALILLFYIAKGG